MVLFVNYRLKNFLAKNYMLMILALSETGAINNLFKCEHSRQVDRELALSQEAPVDYLPYHFSWEFQETPY